MKTRYLVALTLVALLAGCAQPIQPQYHADTEGKWVPNTSAIAQRDAALSAARHQAAVDREDTAANRAAADCNYQAKMANANNMGSGGIIGGLTAGILAGNACQDYYRNIGVIR